MKYMKVLHLLPPGFGGIDAYVFSHYKYMDQHKFRFDFLTQNRQLEGAEPYRDFSYQVYPLPATASADRDGFIQYVKRVLSNQYNIFHMHTSYWTGFLLEELAKQAGIKKVIVHAHASFVDEADPQKRKPLLERHEEIKRDFPPDLATDFWACSQLAADWLFGAQIPKSKIRIMKNAIEVERFRFDEARREALRHELGLDGALALGTAGRFAYSKNYDFLLDVFAGFYRKNPRARLLLLGDGELREDLERQIRENRLEDAVLLLGWRTNMEAYFQAMDLFLLPSRFEGLGIAAVEAVASGLPCIVSDQVPKDVVFSPNTRQVPLVLSDWENALAELSQVHIDRHEGVKLTQAAGYDVREQAKELARSYMEGMGEA